MLEVLVLMKRRLLQKPGSPGSNAHPVVLNLAPNQLSAYPFHGDALLPQQCSAPSVAAIVVMASFHIQAVPSSFRVGWKQV